jgi:AAA domain
MFESVIFFEPYRAVLQVLQNFTRESFPMLDYFLGTETGHTPPSYLTQSCTYVLNSSEGSSLSIENLTDLSAWPSADKLGLDKRQHKALHSALTSRVALIQGPPGTGKTFLALRILRSLLANKSLWQGQNDGQQNAKLQISESAVGCQVNWYVKNKIFWKNYWGESFALRYDKKKDVMESCFFYLLIFLFFRITPWINFWKESFARRIK